MRQTYLIFTFFIASCFTLNIAFAQEDMLRGMTAEEYQIARKASVEDLDNDTYVKIGDGAYVLDRYEMKPPYAITGDSGIRKRIDLYKLLERENMSEIGLIAFFTNTETNETFNLVIPNMASKGDVWNMYFDDIHQHDREEKDVALKMSYVLSKEMAYLMQKSSGVDMSAMEQDNSDYDFCFAPDATVTLADGSSQKISKVKVGDQIMSLENGTSRTVEVEAINIHRSKDISLTKAVLFAEEQLSASRRSAVYQAEAGELIATSNHPVMTTQGPKAMAELSPGDVLYRYDPQTGQSVRYRVHFIVHDFAQVDQVFSLEVAGDSYLVENLLVLEK